MGHVLASYFVGEWKCGFDDDSRITLILDSDGEYVMKFRAERGFEKLIGNLGDEHGTWHLDGRYLVLRYKLGDHPAAKIAKLVPRMRLAIWLRGLAGYREEKRMEFYVIKKKRMRLDGQEFRRQVPW